MSRLTYPIISFGRFSKRPEEVLLLCYYDPKGISTVTETIAFIQSESLFRITVFNLFEHRTSYEGLPLSAQVNLNRYSAILIHNTVAYNVDNLKSLDRFLATSLNQFQGVKIVFRQDENFRFQEVAEFLGHIKTDIVFSCLPKTEISKIYPLEVVGSAKFERMLTGYVTPTLREWEVPKTKRNKDIGYRGSIQPLSFGRLAYEKRKIGYDIKRLLSDRNLSLDISSRWEDRKGGEEWFNFLATCKATLGAESGASIFDLNGDLKHRCAQAEEALGPFREDESYAEAYLAYLSDLEGNVQYNQVSPRHFEAVATRTLQWLYPGSYSGIFQPHKHYFPLNRDYSNLEEAIDLLLDDKKREELVEQAYEEILLNEEYWIEGFVHRLDECIAEELRTKGLESKPKLSSKVKSRNILLIAAHEPKIDPRLGWIADYAPGNMRVHQCGVLPPASQRNISSLTEQQALYLADPRQKYVAGSWREWSRLINTEAGEAATKEILFIEQVLDLKDVEFAEYFGAPVESQRLIHFRWYLNYFLDTCYTLLSSCMTMQGINAVIATDLDTLLPGLVLKDVFKVPLIYDSHEYWPDSDANSGEFERSYWIALEKKLVKHTDYRQVVSPGLAKLMQEEYGCNFNVLSNVEPFRVEEANHSAGFTRRTTNGRGCSFLFQGGFSLGRGLEELIEAWAGTNENALLILRGHDNEFKEKLIAQAKKLGLLDKQIFFPPAVDESELIAYAAKSDVGLIPYPNIGYNYKHCSPNKLSQYMAAGIPVLANHTSYVSQIILESKCGLSLDFRNTQAVVEAVNLLCENSQFRYDLAANGLRFRKNSFNWQLESQHFYQALDELATKEESCLQIHELKNSAYFFPKTLHISEIGTRQLAQVILGEDWHSARAEKLKNYLRPIWRALPEAMRARVRNTIFRKY